VAGYRGHAGSLVFFVYTKGTSAFFAVAGVNTPLFGTKLRVYRIYKKSTTGFLFLCRGLIPLSGGLDEGGALFV